MNTKNLDAIKRMVTRLQAIKETDTIEFPNVLYNIRQAVECLQEVVAVYDAHTPTQDTEEVRTD